MTQQLDSMFFYYQKAYDVACAMHHESAEKYVLSEYISAYMDYGLIEKGEALLKQLPQEMKEENPIALYSQGMVHRYHHRTDSMVYYFQKALKNGNVYLTCDIYKMLLIEAARQGDCLQLPQYAMRCIALKDSIAKITRTESIAQIHAAYNYQLTEEENSDLKLDNERIKRYFLTGAFFALTVIAAIYLWARHRQRLAAKREKHFIDTQETIKQNSQAQLEENNRRIASLETNLNQAMDAIKAKDIQLAQIQAEKEQLLEVQQKAEQKNRMQTAEHNQTIAKLEELLQQEKEQKENWQRQALLIKTEKEMLEFSNRKIQVNRDEKELKRQALRRSDIYLWFHDSSNWAKVRDDSSEWDELRKQITDIYPNFVRDIRSWMPRIKDSHLKICLLIKSEVPVNGMAEILRLTASAISNARKEMYEKVFGKKVPDGETRKKTELFDEFILNL